MLNTNNLKVGEVVIVQKDDCYYLAEVKEIINNNRVMICNSTGNIPEHEDIKNIHKILNKFAFTVQRKKNQEDTKC